jgi:hypothetical protein
MKLPQLLQKPLQIAALSAGALLSSAAPNEAQAQQSWPRNNLGNHEFHDRNEIFGGGFPSGPGILSAAGTNIAQGYWAPIYNQQIQNPTRNNFSPYGNNFNSYGNGYNQFGNNFNQYGNGFNSNRSQGQAFSRPQASPNPGYSPNQIDTRSIEKQKKHLDTLEQIKNAKTSPDGTFKYVLNINDSKFHLIIPISKDFQLPDMKEMYRVKFKDPFKAGTPYYYLVTNDSIETSYQQQQQRQTKDGIPAVNEACRNTTSSLRKLLCCSCK